jgi:hypothetical protein
MQQHKYPHILLAFKSVLLSSEEEKLLSIPGIRKRKTSYLVPHHALQVANQLVSALNLVIKSAFWSIPPNTSYPWPHYEARLRYKAELQGWVLEGFLTPFQIDAIVKTGHMTGTHLWHPTGAGKTLSAILWCLIEEGPIIAITRAASRLQFGREFERFTHLRPYVLRPLTKKKQITVFDYLKTCQEKKQRPVVIVGWEALSNNLEVLTTLAKQGASVIFDESHKGKSTKRWQAVPLPEPSKMTQRERTAFYRKQQAEARRQGGFIPKEGDSQYKGPDMGRCMIVPIPNLTTSAGNLARAAERVICTTATPIKDRVRDLWAQLDLAEPFSWGGSNCWLFRYCAAKPGTYGGLDTRGSSNLEELSRRLELVTHKIDYRDTHRHLPAKRRQSMYISPEDQCRATGGFAKELRAAGKRSPISLLETRLAQAASKKRRAVLSLVDDHVSSGHKVVIFSGRRRDVDQLGVDIRKQPMVKKKKATIWAAHGGVDTGVRQGIVDDYMKHKGPCVLVGTGDAFGESLNLQDTDAALFVMLPYTPGQIRQWEGRFCRLGQKRPVTIYYVICEDSIEEHIAEILINKMDAVERIVDDEELAEAAEAIGGTDNEEELMSSILDKL